MPFPRTGFFPEKSGKFPVPGIREHPLPGPDSVPVFGTGFFPSCFRSGNIWEFPNAIWIKINNCLFPGFLPDFPEQRDHKEVVLSQSHHFRNCPPVLSCLVSFKMSSGMQTSTRFEPQHCHFFYLSGSKNSCLLCPFIYLKKSLHYHDVVTTYVW